MFALDVRITSKPVYKDDESESSKSERSMVSKNMETALGASGSFKHINNI